MPRAAPGVSARWAMRRILPGHPQVSAEFHDRHREGYSLQLGRAVPSNPVERKRCIFTLHSSSLGVELGRMGEVESLVGDCRPPPPGNPRRLTCLSVQKYLSGGREMNPVQSGRGFYVFTPMVYDNRGKFQLFGKHPTLYKLTSPYNLKTLNKSQYFKNSYSSSPCLASCSVLKFSIFHYHLYGIWLVEPPSIAITNVLVIRKKRNALPVL
jgi:hypothetical protein